MSYSYHNPSHQQRSKPLMREAVEKRLQEVGSSGKLDLSRQHLEGIDLQNLDLSMAKLSEAYLEGANLSGAILRGADLLGARLQRARLENADLREANLRGVNLDGANLRHADLRGADLSRSAANASTLQGADLEDADLSGADLRDTLLSGARLIGTDLSGARMNKIPLWIALLKGAHRQPGKTYTRQDLRTIRYTLSTVDVRILETPLTASNFAAIISAIGELHTMCWLIARRRLADVIEYSQTRDMLLEEAAPLTIAKLIYNSPAEIKFNLDLSPQSVVEALVKAIDGVGQAPHRFESAALENQAKQQKIKWDVQRADLEKETAQLEREKLRLEIEKQRLELLEKRLEVQKRGIDYALEIANNMMNVLYPDADGGTRAMLIQALLPKLLHLENGKGLELALPAPKNEQGEKTNKP